MNQIKKRKIDWWIYVIPILFLFTIISHIIIYSRPGGVAGMMIYALSPFLISFLACLFLIIAIIRSLIRRPFLTKWRIIGFIGLLLFPVSYYYRINNQGNFFNAYPSSHENEISKVEFRIPFDSAITVAWGGDYEKVNYHVIAPDQRWAYDLLVTKNGKTYFGDSTKLNSYYIYGLSVLASADGKVIEAYDKDPDMPIGMLGGGKVAHGNHIVIEVAPKQYLIYCHLQPSSITVKKGDIIKQGQILALVGNSGNTSEPHLHIHLQDSEIPSLGEGIPLYFYNYFADGNFVERGMPTGGIDEIKMCFSGQIIQHKKN